MINKDTIKKFYPLLSKEWQKIDKMSNYQKVNKRLKNAVKILNGLNDVSDLNLLDIGCNSGLLSVVSSQRFNRIIGTDFNKVFFKRAKRTKDIFKDLGFQLDNVKFNNMYFSDYIASGRASFDNINAVLACQVLYHMDNKDIELLIDLFKSCYLVVIETNLKRPRTNNKYALITVEKIKDFLIDVGFNNIDVIFEDCRWPVLIAKRNVLAV